MKSPKKSWNVAIPKGRDLQLVGKGRVMIGTLTGYEEYDIRTGNKSLVFDAFPGTISCRRLRNGNTLLVGLNWQESEGIVLLEVDADGAVKRKIVYPDFKYARLVRETVNSTYLITANNLVFEGDTLGNVLWQAKMAGNDNPHAWQPIRLANGQTVVAGGYTGNIQFFNSNGKVVRTISGPDEVNPNFYSGLQIMANNNLVVANWQGHGAENGAKGVQILEYTPEGKLAWSWKQDPSVFSSIQGVIVLDNLNLNKLHVESANGYLEPIN